MLAVAARTVFRIQERLLGRRTFAILRQLQRSQWWPREKIEQLRQQRLAELLTVAYEQTRYWREVMDANGITPADVRSLEDLHRFPLLEKSTIRSRREEMVWRGAGSSVRLARTSGSTSGAMEFHTSSAREANITAARIRGHRWMGVEPGQKEVYFWGAPVELNTQGRLKQIRDFLTNTPLSDASEISPEKVRRYASLWKKWKARCLFGYPSSFLLFARMAKQIGVDLTSLAEAGLMAVCTTAEMLSEANREAISDAFGAAVYDTYGLREGGLVGHECEHFTMHTTDEQLILETIDPTTLQPTGGEGELVLTNLTSGVMPVIRYRTGDMVTLSEEPCPCGRSLHSIRVTGGRLHDFVITSQGQWIGSIAFSRICDAEPGIVKFQVRQHRLGEINILLATDEGFSRDGIERIASAVRSKLSAADHVTVEVVDDIPPAASGKYRPVISDVAEQLRRDGRYTP